MKVIVAGGTGFVGQTLIRGLIEDGHQVIIVKRPGSKTKPPGQANIEIVTVDMEKPIIARDIIGDAIINLAGIIKENRARGLTFFRTNFLVTKSLIDFAVQNNIGQFLQMSALGTKPDSQTAYEETKYAAECYVAESGLNWTIYRPSIIVGPDGYLINMLAFMIRHLPVVPVIGNGQYKVQPVYVEDVAAGFRKALGNERAKGRIFEFGGPEVMTFDQMLDTIAGVMGHNIRKWHQPLWMLRPIAALMGRYPWFPLTNDQITMLAENNCTDDNSYFDFFQIAPKRFKDALKEFME